MSVERQTAALLALVAADRARKCEAILAEARSRADALLAEAHAQARRQMRAAFAEERELCGARVAAAVANLQTRRRAAFQRRETALLAEGWRKLPDALATRWADAAARAAWVAAVVASARAVLPKTAWRIVHAPDWPQAEREALARELARDPGVAAELVADASVRAGLKIAALGNVVDSTLQGLTADRAEIGARLLDLLERES